MKRFADRAEAGRRLAERLRDYAGRDDVIVLGLPRGGVPVAAEVARALGAPLDVFLVRKLGVPGREELAFGAIASGGARVLNNDVVGTLGIDARTIEQVATREQAELERRAEAYRGTAAPPDLAGRTTILVDDGLATGASMRAAVEAVRGLGPERVVVAVPAAARQTCDELARDVDEVVCLLTPEPFFAVGLWYRDFSETSDDDVRAALAEARR
jgi:predicted phosphoribosyltransferase